MIGPSRAKQAVIGVMRRLPPSATGRAPAGRIRTSLVKLHGEVLRTHPIAFTAAPTRYGFTLGGTTADLLQRNVYLFGQWEPNISRWVPTHLRPGDVVVDIGANVGYFSLLAARSVGPGGRVIAFEPVPSIVASLRANLARNGIENVTVVPEIAADVEGEAEIFRGDPGNLGLSATTAGRGKVSEGRVKSARAADRIDPELWPTIRLVKVDTEGDDLRALRGLEPVLRAMRPGAAALVEISPAELRLRGTTAEQLLDFMRGVGFDQVMSIANSYEVSAYIEDRPRAPEPLGELPADGQQVDAIFLKR